MFELTAKSDKEYEIKMYGTIAEWMKVNAKDFEKSMTDAINSGAKTIILPTHCPGGSVHEGIAMATSIRLARSKGVKVIQRVDGISASMSAVIGSCCDEVEGAPFTRIMIHEGQWGAYGNVSKLRETADELERMNKDLADMHADKVKRTKPDLKRDSNWVLDNWMTPGKDKWFSIDEAIKEGIADRKIAATIKELPKPEAVMCYSFTEMVAVLDPYFKDDTKKNKMDRDELIKQFGLKADATDAEILAAIAKLKTDAAAKKEEKKEDPAKKETPDASSDATLEPIVALAKDRGMTDAQIESVKILAKTDVKAAMALIPEKKAETDAANINDLLKAFKAGNASNNADGDRAKWSLRDWEQKDAKGLQAMINKEPQKYAKLFEASYGYEPNIEDIKALSITR